MSVPWELLALGSRVSPGEDVGAPGELWPVPAARCPLSVCPCPQVYVLKRPHVDEFLQRMGELFECVLFTASLAKVGVLTRPGIAHTFPDTSPVAQLPCLPTCRHHWPLVPGYPQAALALGSLPACPSEALARETEAQ